MQASILNDCLKKQLTYRNPTECDWQKFDECYIPFWCNLADATVLKGTSQIQLQEIMQKHETVASKNYCVQNDVPVQDSAKLFKTNTALAY